MIVMGRGWSPIHTARAPARQRFFDGSGRIRVFCGVVREALAPPGFSRIQTLTLHSDLITKGPRAYCLCRWKMVAQYSMVSKYSRWPPTESCMIHAQTLSSTGMQPSHNAMAMVIYAQKPRNAVVYGVS